jgi:hypothetical protein
MNWSLLPTLIVFTAVALSVGAVYLLLSWLANALGRLLRRFRPVRPVSCRPGEVVHQALKMTGRRWDQLRTAALLFCVSLALLVGFGRTGWWPELSVGIYIAIGLVLLLLIGFGATVMVQLVRYRVRLSKLLNTHIEVAQRLTEAQLRGNRVYHAVPLGGGIIDNVVVGSNGVYTINLVTPPAKDCESVNYRRNGLVFLPGALRNDMRPYREAIVALTGELSRCIGNPVVVQPVVVVADCRIGEAPEDSPLLVTMECCTTFIGWKNNNAFLMDHDIEKINDWLSRQVLEHQTRSGRQLADCLDGDVIRPALV